MTNCPNWQFCWRQTDLWWLLREDLVVSCCFENQFFFRWKMLVWYCKNTQVSCINAPVDPHLRFSIQPDNDSFYLHDFYYLPKTAPRFAARPKMFVELLVFIISEKGQCKSNQLDFMFSRFLFQILFNWSKLSDTPVSRDWPNRIIFPSLNFCVFRLVWNQQARNQGCLAPL